MDIVRPAQTVARGIGYGAVGGLVVGGLTGTALVPLIGTVVGAAFGAVVGTLSGLVCGTVLLAAVAADATPEQCRLVAAAAGAGIGFVQAMTVFGGTLPAASGYLVAASAGVGAALGPRMAYPHPPTPYSSAWSRGAVSGSVSAGLAFGTVVGAAIGFASHLRADPRGALAVCIFAALGAVLGLVAGFGVGVVRYAVGRSVSR